MPLSVRIGVTVILLALAVALIVTVLRARAGRLHRNGLSGLRTPSALVDDAAFDRANRAAMPFLLVAAVWAVVVAVAVALTGLDAIGGSGILIVAGVLLGALLLLGGLRGERAARRGLTTPAGTPGARSRSEPAGTSAGSRSKARRPTGAGPKVSGRGGGPRRPSR
jgi:hypothetical protein